MLIEIHDFIGLPSALKQELQARVNREWGDIAIVQEHVWSEPTWVFLAKVDEDIVSYLNIVDRTVTADDKPQHFFGLNNVITEPAHRGNGYATALNRKALEYMKDTDANACGFLFCADELIPFYQKLGWTQFTGEVTVSQPAGDKRWTSNAMLFDPNGHHQWHHINLCGLPW